jgi:hypothetical protein
MVRRAALILLVVSSRAFAQDEGLKAWGKIYEVLSSPRCSNCHVGADNTPMWSGAPHGMYISAGESHDVTGDRDGTDFIPCGACHGKRNSPLPHGPPGALGPPKWGLPPSSMQWSGKSSVEICEQIKDPNFNGSRRSVSELTDHLESGLVRWGWTPGAGRKPAPYSVAELVAFLREWDAADRPCPAK